MAWFQRRRRTELPQPVKDAVALGSGERVLAWAADENTGGFAVATTYHLAFVSGDGELAWQRPWHEAESGTWQGESSLLTVVWVDHRRPTQWLVREPAMFPQTLRERLQASVVLADEFRTENRRTVRVVVRQNLATGGFVEQIVPGKGADLRDPAVAAEARDRLARLRSEVGL